MTSSLTFFRPWSEIFFVILYFITSYIGLGISWPDFFKSENIMIPCIFNLGTGEVIVICVVVLLLFGAKRIPELARSFGKGISSFKQGLNDATEEAVRENDKKSDGKSDGASSK